MQLEVILLTQLRDHADNASPVELIQLAILFSLVSSLLLAYRAVGGASSPMDYLVPKLFGNNDVIARYEVVIEKIQNIELIMDNIILPNEIKTNFALLLCDFKVYTNAILSTKRELNYLLDVARSIGANQNEPWSKAEVLTYLKEYLQVHLPNQP